MSPSSMTRSPISWWGFAPLGPDPTTVKSTCECPNRRSRPAKSAATSVSRRPANRTWRISSYARSAAAAAAASRSTSAASLMARNIGRPLVSDTYEDWGSSTWSPSTCIAHAESEIAYRPVPASSLPVAS